MPFPWREFVWLTLLIGLLIGLATEHARYRKFSLAKEQAERTEQATHELAYQLQTRFGVRTNLSEFNTLSIVSDDWQRRNSSSYSFGGARPERDQSLLTGMMDADFALLLLVVVAPLSALAGILVRKAAPTTGKAYSKASLSVYRFVTPFSILMACGMSISGYCDLRPFTGTLAFAGAIFMLTFYLTHPGVSLTPELSQQIDEKYEQATAADLLRPVFRWQLRDFFWLTLLIGVSCAIVSTHKHARELSVNVSRLEWWDNALRTLREFSEFRLHSLPQRVVLPTGPQDFLLDLK
ncbi:hypothetical protein [Anatilimnocola floriformis]|uniref:hypothetical protein n=1 Tax=Anatilimnocola floriformis TaxID=2948575 RepID=UPI0020C426B6|nr:hypothetical protein [Anatilimnocola floriformis]